MSKRIRAVTVSLPDRAKLAGLLLAAGLAGCGGASDVSGEPESSASAAPSSTIRSMPGGDTGDGGAHVPIESGTYLIPSSAWSVTDFTVTFPEGWTVQYGHVFAQHADTDEFGFYAVVVDEIYADACRGDRGDVVTVGPGVQDLVDALLEQPGPAKRGPVDTALGGYPATRIDLSLPRRLQHRDCFLGPGTGVQVWYSEPADKYFVLLPDAVASVYVVDVDGRRQVFLAQVGNPRSAADRAELQKVLDSIRFEG
jgi:hypothetical protein